MWEKLNHPLEMLGKVRYKTAKEAESRAGESGAMVAAVKAV
jgi:hypothetical protein